MKKLLVSVWGGLVSAAVMSDTFIVDIDVTVEQNPINLEQTQAMTFPQVTVDEATAIGAICYSSSENTILTGGNKATNVNSLCPGLIGTESRVEISGTPHALVSITQGSPTQITNGIEFKVAGSHSSVQLSGTDGKSNTSLVGYITLQDKSVISSGLITFSYDVTAAYQ